MVVGVAWWNKLVHILFFKKKFVIHPFGKHKISKHESEAESLSRIACLQSRDFWQNDGQLNNLYTIFLSI